MKKITSLFLALVMALSLTVPAFATSGTVKVEGTIQLPTINVTLPTTASMIMNPYNMEVKLNPKDPATATNDQIVSPVMEVTNLSNIGIQVGVQIAGTKGRGDAKFATATTTSSTEKEAFIYAVFQIGAAGMDIDAPATPVTADAANVALLDEPSSGATTGTLKDVTNFETAAGTAADANNTLAATVLDPVTNKQVAAPTGVLGFKFFGDISPVTTWTDKDTLGATLTFKFTPVAVDTTPSAGDASVSVAVSSGTATATFNAGTSGLTATSYAWSSGTTATATIDTTSTTNTATVTDVSSNTGDSTVITVVVTLSNGATVTGTATYTIS